MKGPCNGIVDLDLRVFVGGMFGERALHILCILKERIRVIYYHCESVIHSVSQLPNHEFSSQRFQLASLTRAVASSSHLRRTIVPAIEGEGGG